MNILIPIGGKGERFSKCGYNVPKPLIPIFGKPMISYVIDNLFYKPEDKIFVIYYDIDGIEIIKEKYPFICFIKISHQTKGASETIYYGLQQIINEPHHNKTMILDCDTFYTEDVRSIFYSIQDNAVFYTINVDIEPIFSYICMDNDNKITQIQEKIKISDNANTGVYCFTDIYILYAFARQVVEKNIMFRNEYYISCIISEMIKSGHVFIGLPIQPQFVFNLGTPKQLEKYKTDTHIFLFDLDGTLVISDHIYFNAWKDILKEYQIIVTEDYYKNNIFGNNDASVLQKIFPIHTIHKELLEQISKSKDDFFRDNISEIRMIDGGADFLKELYMHGHKMAIVTNCNRTTSELILKYLNIDHFFEFITTGNECSRPKPYPDPYTDSIRKFNASNEKTIIFEDSKTGFLSAKGTTPKCIVGLETNYSHDEIIKNGANISIKNFTEITMDDLLFNNTFNHKKKLVNYIKSAFREPVTSVDIKNIKLKGGFISDCIGVTIITNNNTTINSVIKLENKENNCLSSMSHLLDLYEREYYFYETISKYVPINIPKYYGLIKDENCNTVGIIMENLFHNDYKLNLNLNVENINVSLTVIDSMAKMHAKFWNKDLQKNFPNLKKHNDAMFCPSLSDFVSEKWPIFKEKWSINMTQKHIKLFESTVSSYKNIQKNMSENNLTFCHGDIKSANIFYKPTDSGYEPYFLDWQYICIGKGAQDLVFFMIESFDSNVIHNYHILFKEYYYLKLVEYGVTDYSRNDFEMDFLTASYYFPFFVAIWFGSMHEDELIDKKFPTIFIRKLLYFYDNMVIG